MEVLLTWSPVLRVEWLVWSKIHSGKSQKDGSCFHLWAKLSHTDLGFSHSDSDSQKGHWEYYFYKSINLLLTEQPESIPEVPSTEFLGFDVLEKTHIQLLFEVQLILLLLPWNYRACSKKTAYSFSTTRYAKELSLQYKHAKYHYCHSKIRQRFHPPLKFQVVLQADMNW